MSRLNYRLSVNIERDAETDENHLHRIADEFGFECGGSGTGFGLRDIDWSRPTPLTPEQITALCAKLRATDVYDAYYEEEVYDEADDLVFDRTIKHSFVTEGEPR